MPSSIFMSGSMSDFQEFAQSFVDIFTKQSFRGSAFSGYMGRPANKRTGDEASIVDAAIMIPLLGLLGFEPGEQAYNRQHHGDRVRILGNAPSQEEAEDSVTEGTTTHEAEP